MQSIGENQVFTIGEFIKLCDTTRETLYHYEKQGLLTPLTDPNNGYRSYTPHDYYTFMLIAHLTRIGFSLHEVKDYLPRQTLSNYFDALTTSDIRNEEKQEQLKLRRERTTRGLDQLKSLVNKPLDTPQITYREEELFLRVPFDNDDPIISDVLCSSEQDRYCKENGFDIQRHFHGYYSEEPFKGPLPVFDYNLAKLAEPCESERLFVRPAGMYISMCYKGPFYGDCAPSYKIVSDYLKYHRYKPLTGMFVEIAVGPFHTKDVNEFVAELSIKIE